MERVTITGSNIISSLGFTSEENFRHILNGTSGLCYQSEGALQPLSLINQKRFKERCHEHGLTESLSGFEKLCVLSITDAISQSSVNVQSQDCQIIIASTKGNIGLLETGDTPSDSIHLWESARKIGQFFQTRNRPMVISHACISGVTAQIVAVRMLNAGYFKNVVVCGADLITDFILSGFQSFKALSENACKPFDKNRNGLSLGEGAGTLVFSTTNGMDLFGGVRCLGGASSNDANHISGPSRTGDGLAHAIHSALSQSKIIPQFISAHGTATPYNDEMESKAIALAGLSDVPVNSLKGFFGHTLGAAGMIETITTLYAMEASKGIGTLGFEEYGVSEKINVTEKTKDFTYQSFLKIASGFGGCNAAVVYSK